MLYLQLLFGLVLLVAGGELLVRGAVSLAGRLGISPLVVGLTVVGFGTSTPELVTSLQAAFSGSPGIAVGNVVGSNTANILLILGIAALIYPVSVAQKGFFRDGLVISYAALAAVVLAMLGELGRLAGLILVASLVAYIAYAIIQERRLASEAAGAAGGSADDIGASAAADAQAVIGKAPSSLILSLVLAVGGIVVTILGARFLVDAAIVLAGQFGISDAVIGLTVVAVGTSLPELVTSVVASLKRQGDIAFGNVVGSNIYNILGILGVTALVHPIEVPAQIASFDVWIMLAVTAALIGVAVSGWRITRMEGALLLAGYVAYIGWLVVAQT